MHRHGTASTVSYRRYIRAGARAWLFVVLMLSAALSPVFAASATCATAMPVASMSASHHMHMAMTQHAAGHSGHAMHHCNMPCCLHGAGPAAQTCHCGGLACGGGAVLTIPTAYSSLPAILHEPVAVTGARGLPDAPVPQVPTPPPRLIA